MFRFDRSPEVLALLRRELGQHAGRRGAARRRRADAALAKPYLGTRPGLRRAARSTSASSREALRDLDDVRFVEIPWLVDAGRARRSRACRARDYPERRARPALRARHRRLPRRAGVRRRHAPSGSSSTAPPDTSRSTPTRQFVREATLLHRRCPRRATASLPPAATADDADAARASRARSGSAGGRTSSTARGLVDRRAQLSAAAAARSISSRATATRSCSSRCGCARRGDFGGAAASITAAKRARIDRRGERSTSRGSRARRRAGSTRCCSTRSIPRASSGCSDDRCGA